MTMLGACARSALRGCGGSARALDVQVNHVLDDVHNRHDQFAEHISQMLEAAERPTRSQETACERFSNEIALLKNNLDDTAVKDERARVKISARISSLEHVRLADLDINMDRLAV